MRLYIEYFMTYCTSKNLSKKTMKSYEQTLKLFSQYMEDEFQISDVTKITRHHIRSYIQNLQSRGKYTITTAKQINNNPEARNDFGKTISPNTINNYLRNLKVFFNWLVEEEEILKNPLDKVPFLKKSERVKEMLSEEEIKTILDSFDQTKFDGYRNYIITLLIFDSGIRITECLSIKAEDIDFNNNLILMKDTKNKQERVVFFSLTMRKELKKWLQYKDRYINTDFVFPSNRGNQLKIHTYETALRNLGKNLNLKLYPHRIRANFAQYFLLNGGDLISLSRILGHSSIEVTKIYLQFDNKTIAKQHQKFSPLSNF